MRKALAITLLLLAASCRLLAQNADSIAAGEFAIPIEFIVDTLHDAGGKYLGITLPKVMKTPPIKFANEESKANFYRLVRQVKKVWPFAVAARHIILETFPLLEGMSKSEQREHIKMVEKEVRMKYQPQLEKLSTSEGKLLAKLIYRECGQSGYDVAKAILGQTKANIYQGIAFLFGQSLKKKYDPKGADRITERVVRLVESGQI